MDNLTKIRHTPHRKLREQKRNNRYNDSLIKNKTSFPTNLKMQKIGPTEKFQIAMKNLREGLEEIRAESLERENRIEKEKQKDKKYNITTTRPLKKFNLLKKYQSLSVPKYHYLRTTTPTRTTYPFYSKKNYILNTSLHKSYFTNNNDYANDSGVIKAFRPSLTVSRDFSRRTYRKSLRPNKLTHLNRDKRHNFKLKSMEIDNDIKSRELNNMNLILQRQNKELRQNIREMRYKINDLLNKIKLLRLESQRLTSEKSKMINHISNLENELDITKNFSLNELELKSNQIAELNEQIINLNRILEAKENEINILNNKVGNGNGMNELNDDMEGNNNMNMNKNDLLNQINDLNKEIQILRRKNGENGKISNNSINNSMNDERINKIFQENQKYKINYNNLRKEYEKMKNYASSIKSQKTSFEITQSEMQQNIDNLVLQLNGLQEENNSLKNLVNNQNSMLKSKKKGSNNNINNENQLKNQIKKLIEENNMLKAEIERNNHSEELNYLKNDVEEKNIELKDLNEKLKNLMSQLTISKNNTSDLSKQNSKLESDIQQLNNKISNLENENFNKHQQIRELHNINNKLKIKVNSINSGSLNNNIINNQKEQQLLALKKQNEELEDKLLNLKNSIAQEKNELILENSELKNEILNLKKQINDLENDNHSKIIKLSKLNEIEKQLKEAKNECQINFNQLKIKENENKNLLDIIKQKDRENEEMKIKYSKSLKTNSNNNIEDEMNEEVEELKKSVQEKSENIENLNIEMIELKRNFDEKNIIIEKLEKEIEGYKNANNKILLENAQLKEKLQLMQNEQEDGLLITLDNLKEELKDKGLQIEKLIEENNTLRKSNIKNRININNEDEKEVDFNKNEINPFRNTINSNAINEVEKLKIYKDEIKELKLTNDSDQIQIKTLKADIKELKEKLKNFQTFSGQLKDFNEFLDLINKIVENYKPKKKEQKDALNKLSEVMKNFHF